MRIRSSGGGKSSISFRSPLDRLNELVSAYPQLAVPELPPFQGGAVGLLSYDFVRYLEDIPRNAVDDLYIPDVHFMMADRIIAFDHFEKKAWIVISPGARQTELGYRDAADIDWNGAYDEAEEALSTIGDRLKEKDVYLQQSANFDPSAFSHRTLLSLNYEMSKEHYMEMVMKAKEYIAAGDIFQANISQRLSAFVDAVRPWDIYKRLRYINPSPFAAFADFGSYSIVSSSPERLVTVKDLCY